MSCTRASKRTALLPVSFWVLLQVTASGPLTGLVELLGWLLEWRPVWLWDVYMMLHTPEMIRHARSFDVVKVSAG